jgi:hypothetical protein
MECWVSRCRVAAGDCSAAFRGCQAWMGGSKAKPTCRFIAMHRESAWRVSRRNHFRASAWRRSYQKYCNRPLMASNDSSDGGPTNRGFLLKEHPPGPGGACCKKAAWRGTNCSLRPGYFAVKRRCGFSIRQTIQFPRASGQQPLTVLT